MTRYFVETRKSDTQAWTVALVLPTQAEAEQEADWERQRGREVRVWRAELIAK
jgi:hypothetical protein